MRIAVVNNFFPPRTGGSAHLSDNLARSYAANGHTVLVITATYGQSPLRERRDGIDILRIPAWTLPRSRFAANFDIGFTISPKAKRRVFDALDHFAPDVIHQHGQFFDLTWLSGWWARSRGVPTLLSIHTRLESPLSRFNSFIYAIADTVLVAPLMRVHRPELVVMDIHMDRYIDKRYGRVIRGKTVIPVGVDPARMRGGNGENARAFLKSGDRPLILSLGHVIPQRNRLALVRAMPAVLSKHPDALVAVVGGLYHQDFLALAEQLGVRESIAAVGAVPQQMIPDLLAAADLEVHELEGQGFGTASLEALGAGTPVVAAVRPDNFIDIALVDGRDLFIAPFVSTGDERADPAGLAAAIVAVLDDPAAARRRVGENGRAIVDSHFSLERIASKHMEVLSALIDASPPAPRRSPRGPIRTRMSRP